MSLNVRQGKLAVHRWLALGGAALAVAGLSAGCQFGHASLMATEPGTDPPVVTSAEWQLLSDVPNAIDYADNGTVPANVEQDSASGPGIVVCSAVTPTGDTGLGGFAEGCAAWLQLVVGGQPQFGRTPSWHAPARVAGEMKQPGLHLSALQAQALRSKCGATHAAVATLTSTGGGNYLLSYQLVRTSDSGAVGSAIVASGTRAQITAQLPGIGAKLAQGLGLAHPIVPAAVGATASDMEFLGRCRWSVDDLADADKSRLDALAHQPGDALAAVLDFYGPTRYSTAEKQAMAELALSSLPGNAQIVSEAAAWYPEQLSAAQRSLIASQAARYPHNYNLTVAQALSLGAQDAPAQVKIDASLRAVRCSTENTDAWKVADRTLEDASESIRRSRTAGGLTGGQWGQLSVLYANYLGCAERGVHLDPDDGLMWSEVAGAATFNGQSLEADAAERRALHMDADLAHSYWWALQMYAPKWGGDPAKMSAAVDLAAADTRLSPANLLYIAQSVGDTNGLETRRAPLNQSPVENALAQHDLLINVAVRRLQPLLKSMPSDAAPHETLGDAYAALNEPNDAQQEYETAARLAPSDPDVQFTLGDYLYKMGLFGRAMTQYQTVARLEPGYPEVHFSIGYAEKERGDYSDALSEFDRELSANPRSAKTYAGIGMVYEMERDNAKAAQAFVKCVGIDPWMYESWHSAANDFDAAKEYKQSIAIAEKGLTFVSTNSSLYVTLQDDYLNLKRPDTTIQLCQEDLTFDRNPQTIAYSHENMAEALLQKRDFPAAQREWQIVVESGDPQVSGVARGFLAKYPVGKAVPPPLS